MSDDKKLNITGEVKIDQGKATSDLAGLKAELDGFRTSLANVATGIELILRSLASMAKSMQTNTQEGKAAAQAAKDEAESMAKAAAATGAVQKAAAGAAKSVKDVAVNTDEVVAKTEIVRGAWQRIGHQAVDMVANSLAGLIQWMFRTADEASKINATFQQMSVRGVQNIDKLKVSVTELAGRLGESPQAVLKAVDMAEQLGAGAESINVARAALENYKVTGMDVGRQIERSSQIVKTFNMDLSQQVGVINNVSQAAQQAHISQDKLWNGLTTIGPKIRQVGGDFQDMMEVIQTAAASGIKIDETGPNGLNQLLDNLIKGSSDFAQKLVELGGVITASSPRWKELKGSIDEQKTAFNNLNAEISQYKQQATDIGLMASKTESLMGKYQALAGKKENGERLNRLERKALRELTAELHEQNKELSAYDQQGLIVQDHEFKRLSLTDQLKTRLESAKTAQADLNLKTQEAQVPLDNMKISLSNANAEFSTLTGKLTNEVPAALQTVAQDQGLPALITMLKSLPGVLQTLPAETQAFINQYNASMGTLSTNTGLQADTISEQWRKLKASGANAMESLRTNISTLSVTLMGPIAKAMDAVAAKISEKLNEPFADGSTVFERVAAWGNKVGATLVNTLSAVISGDLSISDALLYLIDDALNGILELWTAYGQPMLDSLLDSLNAGMPKFNQWVVDQFSAIGSLAVEAFKNAVRGTLDNLTMPVQNLFYGAMDTGGSASLGKMDLSGAAGSGYSPQDTGGSRGVGAPAGRAAPVNSFVINGATDPMSVAREVSRTISQQERLGYSGDRLR